MGDESPGPVTDPTTPEEFFAGRDESRRVFDALRAAIEEDGPAELRVSKSQIAFARGQVFARAWVPDQYLGAGHPPLVLTLGFRHRDPSPRWKQVVEPAPGRYTHHLELRSEDEIDQQVREWIREAWGEATGSK